MTIEKFYYLDDDRKPLGPFSLEELSMLSAQGKINQKTLVAKDGDSEWILYGELILANKTSNSWPKIGNESQGDRKVIALIWGILLFGVVGVWIGISSKNSPSISSKKPAAISSNVPTGKVQSSEWALLEDYVSGGAVGQVLASDAYDGESAYNVQFSNGVMRVSTVRESEFSHAGYTVAEGRASKSDLFDMSCYSVLSTKYPEMGYPAYAICIATQPISQPGESYDGQRYQFTAKLGDVFFISTNLDVGENFPGRRVSKDPVKAALYGKVKF